LIFYTPVGGRHSLPFTVRRLGNEPPALLKMNGEEQRLERKK